MIVSNMKCVHINRNIHYFEDKFFYWLKASNSVASDFVPIADKDNERIDGFSPLDSANKQAEIHHPPIILSPRISTKTITDDGAPTGYPKYH